MVDLQAYLAKKLRGIISQWDEEDIYAVSFFVYANVKMNMADIRMFRSFS